MKIALIADFREGPSNTAFVPKNIDAARELIIQDCHVTYRDIETSLGISSTSIHLILHEHLVVKRFVLVRSRTI